MRAPIRHPYAAPRALNSGRGRTIRGPIAPEFSMLALYIILGFVAVVAAVNFFEFGRID